MDKPKERMMRTSEPTTLNQSDEHDNLVFCPDKVSFLKQANNYYVDLCNKLTPEGSDPDIKFDLILSSYKKDVESKIAFRIVRTFIDNETLFSSHSLESRNQRMDLVLHKIALSFFEMGQHQTSLSGDKWNKTQKGIRAYYLAIGLVPFYLPVTIATVAEMSYQKHQTNNVRTVDYATHKKQVVNMVDNVFPEVLKLSDNEVSKQLQKFKEVSQTISAMHEVSQVSEHITNDFKPSSEYFFKYLNSYLNDAFASKTFNIEKYHLIFKDITALIKAYQHNENDQTIEQKNQRLELIVKKVGMTLAESLKRDAYLPAMHYPNKNGIHTVFDTYKSKPSEEIKDELTALRNQKSFAHYDQRPSYRTDTKLSAIYTSLKNKSSAEQEEPTGKVYSIAHDSRITIKSSKIIRKYADEWLDQIDERMLLTKNAIATFLAENIATHEYSFYEDSLTKSSLVVGKHSVEYSKSERRTEHRSLVRKETKRKDNNQTLEVPLYDYVDPETGINNKTLITNKLTEICERITVLDYDEIQTEVDILYNRTGGLETSDITTATEPLTTRLSTSPATLTRENASAALTTEFKESDATQNTSIQQSVRRELEDNQYSFS